MQLRKKTKPEPAETKSKPKILCVDDEKNILNVLTRGLEVEFEVLTAMNGKEGLEMLDKHNDVVVIVSDQKMPGLTGIEFLEKSQAVIPDAIRIMLTVLTDVNLVMAAINRGSIYNYIVKPFDIEDIKVRIRRAVEHHDQKVAYEKAYYELQKTQQHLIRSEKMSVLGKLMGSVAHELGNPISNIEHAVSLLTNEWAELRPVLQKALAISSTTEADAFKEWSESKDFDSLYGEIDGIMRLLDNSTELAKDIIIDLRGFSRLDDAEWDLLDLHKHIERAINLLRTKFKYKVTFKQDFGELPQIKGLSGPITQVMVNLLNNAAQAIENEGEITIKTWADDSYAKISIKDNGQGIAKDDLDKIFDIGFTTKPEEEGTGLGLSIVHRIIQKHNGTIEVTSEVNKGTNFIISLPRE